MWKQGVLLVVAVDGARGDDVVLVFVHQGQLGVVAHCQNAGHNYKHGGWKPGDKLKSFFSKMRKHPLEKSDCFS